MSFEILEKNQLPLSGQPTKIKVVGVGGGGCNAVNRMIEGGMSGVDFIAVNTDLQSLNHSKASTRLQIGINITQGLGAGANPTIGKEAAEEQEENLIEVLRGSNMVFITAGMGGGTGTGAAPVVARITKKLGALTVGVVTKPFHFEKKKRMQQADEGIDLLRKEVDTIIVIPNENLLHLDHQGITINDSFQLADSVLMNGVKGISDLVVNSGLINVDFADVRTVMQGQGNAVMCSANFDSRLPAEEVVAEVTNNPLVEGGEIKGAGGLLMNLIHGKETSIQDAVKIITAISDKVDPDATCIHGFFCDENLGKDVRITIIATGFTKNKDGLENDRELASRDAQVVDHRKAVEGVEDGLKTEVKEPDFFSGPMESITEKEEADLLSVDAGNHSLSNDESEKAFLSRSLFDTEDRASIPAEEEKVVTLAADSLADPADRPSGAQFKPSAGNQREVSEWNFPHNSKKVKLDDLSIPAFIRFKKKVDF